MINSYLKDNSFTAVRRGAKFYTSGNICQWKEYKKGTIFSVKNGI